MSKTKMAILYLLTADVKLWNTAKRYAKKGYIDLDGINLGNKGYTNTIPHKRI